MFKRVIPPVGFLVLLTLFLIVYLAPASKIVSLVELPRDVKVYHVQGDIWKGSIDTLDVSNFRINNLKWKLNPFTLIFDKGVNLTVRDPELADGNLSFNAFKLPEQVEINNIELTSTVEKIYPYIAKELPWPIKADGDIKANFDFLKLASNGELRDVKGMMVITKGEIEHPFENNIKILVGKVNAKIVGNNKNLVISLDQSSEHFNFTGDVKITNLSKYTIDGFLQPKGALPESLQNLIPFLGKVNNDGKIKVHFTGDF